MKEEVGGVITFASNVTEAKAKEVIQQLKNDGIITHADVRSYDPEWGTPVFYIP